MRLLEIEKARRGASTPHAPAGASAAIPLPPGRGTHFADPGDAQRHFRVCSARSGADILARHVQYYGVMKTKTQTETGRGTRSWGFWSEQAARQGRRTLRKQGFTGLRLKRVAQNGDRSIGPWQLVG